VAQRDSFFAVGDGSLVLRQEDERTEIIEYSRTPGPPPWATYSQRLLVAKAELTRECLAAELGLLATVVKSRRVLQKDNVRIHHDRVQGLGCFVELEAVAPVGHHPRGQLGVINALRRLLGIDDDRLLRGGYLELLRNARAG
jgi:adenylate cyclase class IV